MVRVMKGGRRVRAPFSAWITPGRERLRTQWAAAFLPG
jgi:hypothetical protein